MQLSALTLKEVTSRRMAIFSLMMKVWVLTLSVTFFIQSRELNPRFFTNSANL